MIKTCLEKFKSFHTILIAALLFSLLSFSNAENFGKILDEYKPDELKYFSEVAFFTGKLSRWTEPVRISQEGHSPEDLIVINDMVTELQSVLSVPVSLVPTGGNLVIHHSRTMSEYLRNYSGTDMIPLGYAIPKFSSDNSLIHADIYLHPSLLNDKKNEVLIHEVCHTLGLLDHPSTPFTEDNVMSAAIYRNKNTISTIPRLDKAALKLLYDKRMPKNLLKTDFLKKLSLVTARIN